MAAIRRQRVNLIEDSVTGAQALVAVIDDDDSVRESLPDLLIVSGYSAQAFASAEAFLTSGDLEQTRCLVLDVTMPGMSGPELQRELRRRGHHIPIVFITANSDPAIATRLLAEGAVACLFKPFTETELREAISAALGEK